MTRAETTEALSFRIRRQAFLDQLADHADIGRMRPYRRSANHIDAGFIRRGLRFDVEIEHDLHVIADEADRHHDNIPDAALAESP